MRAADFPIAILGTLTWVNSDVVVCVCVYTAPPVLVLHPTIVRMINK